MLVGYSVCFCQNTEPGHKHESGNHSLKMMSEGRIHTPRCTPRQTSIMQHCISLRHIVWNKTNRTYLCCEVRQKGRGLREGRGCHLWQACCLEASALRWETRLNRHPVGQVCFDSVQQLTNTHSIYYSADSFYGFSQGDHFPDRTKFPDLSSRGKQRLPGIECLPIWSTVVVSY